MANSQHLEELPDAFDFYAETYDKDFTDTLLGKLLRRRVWKVLGTLFSPKSHVLELACGTGEDALWLASKGVHVTATDASSKMLEIAQNKIANANYLNMVKFEQLSFQDIINGKLNENYDGIFSNFGGINTLSEWEKIARELAKHILPNKNLILVPMGIWCPWEFISFSMKGKFRKAFRRLKQPAYFSISQKKIPIWYPSIKQLKTDFSPYFNYRGTKSLGIILPPSYYNPLVERFPNFFAKIASLEKKIEDYTLGIGDHFIIIFERM